MTGIAVKNVTLDSGQHIKYAAAEAVLRCVQEKGFSNAAAFAGTNTSDLTSGTYEGGLKIWEGAIDLCNYLDLNLSSYLRGKRVLELGCGAALPTIYSLARGAFFAAVNDFNDFVLECFCRENFRLNNIPDEKWFPIFGSWKSLLQNCGENSSDVRAKSFDLILTSETIYNKDYYMDLHTVLDYFLSDDGQVLLAAKVYYFGLNTSIVDFQEFVSKQGLFKCTDVWTSSDEGIPRKILRLTR